MNKNNKFSLSAQLHKLETVLNYIENIYSNIEDVEEKENEILENIQSNNNLEYLLDEKEMECNLITEIKDKLEIIQESIEEIKGDIEELIS